VRRRSTSSCAAADFALSELPQEIEVRLAPDQTNPSFTIKEAQIGSFQARRSKKSTAWRLRFTTTCAPVSDKQLGQIADAIGKVRYLAFSRCHRRPVLGGRRGKPEDAPCGRGAGGRERDSALKGAVMPSTIPLAAQPELDIAHLREFPNNPRRTWGDMDGLAASIKAHGILEPLVVRAVNGHFEIIAGARRYRAAKAAGLATVPVTLREASDQVAMELAILENLQRHDVHPLDEALGIEHLMKADKAYTVEAVAAKLGRSPRHVRDRLKLLQLVPSARQAFEEDHITAGHAVILARLDAKQQPAALKACFYQMWQGTGNEAVLRSVKDLERWVAENVALDVAAPETAELFPETAAAVERVTGEGKSVVFLTTTYYAPKPKKGETPILGTDGYREAKKGDACAVTGVFVLGHRRGAVIPICVDKACSTHYPKAATPARAARSTPSTSAADRKKAEERRKREAATAARVKAQRERREQVVGRAVSLAADAAKTVTDDVLRLALADFLMGDIPPYLQEVLNKRVGTKAMVGYQVQEKAIAKLSGITLIQAVTFAALASRSYHEKKFAAALAPFKVDVKKLDGAVAAEQKAAAKVAAAAAPVLKKKAGKKR
jgi:ParB/RepB/Spo0J family partition protein